MGQVALTMKIMPDGMDVNIKQLKEQLSELEGVNDVKEVPIAFGLKMLEVLFVFDDKKGANTDEIESKILAIPGVASVEQGEITLI